MCQLRPTPPQPCGAQARALPSVPCWDCHCNQVHSILGQALLRKPVHATVACFVTAQTYAVILGLWAPKSATMVGDLQCMARQFWLQPPRRYVLDASAESATAGGEEEHVLRGPDDGRRAHTLAAGCLHLCQAELLLYEKGSGELPQYLHGCQALVQCTKLSTRSNTQY